MNSTTSSEASTKKSTMPKELKQKWLDALRSGEYKQGKECLGNLKDGFCCLGLLQYIVDGKTESDGVRDELPSPAWCAKNNCKWNAIDESNGNLWLGGDKASQLNDEGKPFEYIAHLIEEHVEGV